MLRHGELASAKLLLSRADTIIERVRAEGATHELNDANMLRLMTVTLNNTACVHRREGRMEEALCYLEDALKIDSFLATRARHERSADAACLIGPNASALLLNLSTVLAALGRWEEARMRAEGAITCVWSFDTHWQSPHVRASLVHLSLYVSSYAFYHICVRIVLYVSLYSYLTHTCPHMCQERMYAAVAAYQNLACALLYVSLYSYYYIRVLNPTIYVSSYYYIRVRSACTPLWRPITI
jgi:tetratricopeptide (TPR) repeat protein